jgi:RHS repeat-associated protein
LSEKDLGNQTSTKYGYDLAGNLTSIVNYAPDNSVISQYLYVYDDQGRPTSVTTLAGKTTYGYDATGQLTSVSLPGGRTILYQYDAAGNRVSVTDNGVTTNYTTNNLNEYTQVGGVQYTYDKAGDLISQTDSSGTTKYSYNLLGQLVSVVSPAGTCSYTYDALGNRMAVTQKDQQTQYLIDPTGLGNVVGTFDSSGNVIADYTYGLGLTSQVTATGSAYYNFDLTGNTTELTGTKGSVLDTYSFLPFGEVVSATGTTPNPFLYVGQFGVVSLPNGLYFMRHRSYSPSQGRLTQPDPLGQAINPDLYTYALNRPTNSIDPQGLSPVDWLKKIKEINDIRKAYEQGYKDGLDAGSATNPANSDDPFAPYENQDKLGGTINKGLRGAAGGVEKGAESSYPGGDPLQGIAYGIGYGRGYAEGQRRQKSMHTLNSLPPGPLLAWENNSDAADEYPLSPVALAAARGALVGKLVQLPVLIEDL